ncbi:hypothetical protein VB735_12500 [Halotia wernerae UHCC 0503]|nr:hypothetical protein [Halotia wernerae UHCC 0503]
MSQVIMSTLSLRVEELEESQDKILLPPTDPDAEVFEVSGYKLVDVKGACPKVYRVYRDDSMVGLVFQHLTHWANEVDEIRYAKPRDAVVGLEDFAGILRGSDSEQKPLGLAHKQKERLVKYQSFPELVM